MSCAIRRLEEHAQFDAGRNIICLFPTLRETWYVLLKEFFERADMAAVRTIDLRNCRLDISDLYHLMLEFLLSDREHQFVLPSTIDSASIRYFGEEGAIEHEDDDTCLNEADVVVLSRRDFLRRRGLGRKADKRRGPGRKTDKLRGPDEEDRQPSGTG